jgi:hypothetical protein
MAPRLLQQKRPLHHVLRRTACVRSITVEPGAMRRSTPFITPT